MLPVTHNAISFFMSFSFFFFSNAAFLYMPRYFLKKMDSSKCDIPPESVYIFDLAISGIYLVSCIDNLPHLYTLFKAVNWQQLFGLFAAAG